MGDLDTMAVAVDVADLVDRWQDLGGELWLAAGAATAVWFVIFGVLAATNPRRVDPGPETLDLGGPEPPAVVNLITRDWRLGREALPATLLDLAARKHLAIDQVGEQTLVRTRERPAPKRGVDPGPGPGPGPGTGTGTGADPTIGPATATTDATGVGGTVATAPTGPDAATADGGLAAYEQMVLDHVRGVAAHAEDGVVPAEALTTGPDDRARGWWRRFHRAARDDARARGSPSLAGRHG